MALPVPLFVTDRRVEAVDPLTVTGGGSAVAATVMTGSKTSSDPKINDLLILDRFMTQRPRLKRLRK